MAGNTPALHRNAHSACVSANNRGRNRCNIMLPSGTVISFVIESVTDDSLIGRRSGAASNTAAIILLANVAMIEFFE